KRHSPGRDGWMAIEPEQLLHADRKLGPIFAAIINGYRGAGRRLEMRWHFGLEATAQRPRQHALQQLREFVSGERGKRSLADQSRREPICGSCGERGIREIRPFIS